MTGRIPVKVRVREEAIQILDDHAAATSVSRSEVIRAALSMAMRDGRALRQEITKMKEAQG